MGYTLPILFAGIFAIIFGVLISWIISLLLYGFGELIDDTEEIRSITEELYDETHVKASKVSSKAERQ